MSERIWITGAGRGIGREIALSFAATGTDLYLSSRSEEELRDTAAACRKRGATAHEVPVDVRSAASVEECYRRVGTDGAPLDLVVACAGSGSFGPVIETSPDAWSSMIDTNLTGAFLTFRAALPAMVEAGRGRIIVIASVAARVSFPGAAAYCASKAGVVAMANCLREELRPTGVRVGVVIPGAVASTFWDDIETDLDPKRMLPPARVADAVVRMAREPHDGTTEEITLLPPEGIL